MRVDYKQMHSLCMTVTAVSKITHLEAGGDVEVTC
jgi:hypothetical protein